VEAVTAPTSPTTTPKSVNEILSLVFRLVGLSDVSGSCSCTFSRSNHTLRATIIACPVDFYSAESAKDVVQRTILRNAKTASGKGWSVRNLILTEERPAGRKAEPAWIQIWTCRLGSKGVPVEPSLVILDKEILGRITRAACLIYLWVSSVSHQGMFRK
jgi:hypothetical protein